MMDRLPMPPSSLQAAALVRRCRLCWHRGGLCILLAG